MHTPNRTGQGCIVLYLYTRYLYSASHSAHQSEALGYYFFTTLPVMHTLHCKGQGDG